MGKTATMGELLSFIVERQRFGFIDYDPRDVPGFTSDIAKVLGVSDNQTQHLLELVDELDGHHYSVERRPVNLVIRGSSPDEGEEFVGTFPQAIRVTVSQA